VSCCRFDIAAGASAVLDHEGRAVFLLQALRQDAGEHVGGAAGAERDDDRDLALRPIRLRLSVTGDDKRGDQRGREQRSHVRPPCFFASAKLTMIATKAQE
jgi:hypothetical protein